MIVSVGRKKEGMRYKVSWEKGDAWAGYKS
jgi:hypothetical protein